LSSKIRDAGNAYDLLIPETVKIDGTTCDKCKRMEEVKDLKRQKSSE
jgi:hypothetical protein